MKQLSRRAFDRQGLRAEELIFELPNGSRKIVWCLQPYETMEIRTGIESRKNPLFHLDFEVAEDGDDAYEQAARRRCQEAFDAYHKPEVSDGTSQVD